MRRLSRSVFDRFSTLLVNLYACRYDEASVAQTLALADNEEMRGNGKKMIQTADAEKVRPPDSGKLTAKRSSAPHSSRPILLSGPQQGGSVAQQALLALLRPHLVQALQNARGTSQLYRESALLDRGLEAIGLAAIRIDSNGHILDPETRATMVLSNYCALERNHELPKTIHEWFIAHRSRSRHKDETSAPARSLTLENDRGELTVTLLKGEDDWWLLLQERRSVDLEAKLHEAGLTLREAEVLLWVLKGKTNNEVAAILGSQPATIKKHLKRIYVKFGTESRVATVSYARTLIGTP
jgi:DNA-binding CsgD family transcriptional regulator